MTAPTASPTPPRPAGSRWAALGLTAVMCLAVVGYFRGLAQGIPEAAGYSSDLVAAAVPSAADGGAAAPPDAKLIPAVEYARIPHTPMGPTAVYRAVPQRTPALATAPLDPDAVIEPSPAAKVVSTEVRAARRAFNGAPPVIPHAVVDTNDAACYACHSQGMQLDGIRASVMSHAFLANCTQCHAPPAPPPFADVPADVRSSFVGLPAPLAGSRAYPGAPPTIPHSQAMRENCLACHGPELGWPGMESTHPWRSNCTQCHAPSAVLDQGVGSPEVPFLPPPDIVAR